MKYVLYTLVLFPIFLSLAGCAGCSDDMADYFPPIPNPQGFAIVETAKSGRAVTLQAEHHPINSAAAISGNVTYHWNFGDGDGTTNVEPQDKWSQVTHTYAQAGRYLVEYNVDYNFEFNGGTRPTSEHITYWVTVVDFSIEQQDNMVTVTAEVPEKTHDGQRYVYSWDMNNDGVWEKVSEDAKTFTYTYPAQTETTIKFQLTTDSNSEQREHTAAKPISITSIADDGPEIDFTYEKDVSMTVLFGQAPNYEGQMPLFSWDIEDDGVWEAIDLPNSLYPWPVTSGTHSVTMKVTWGNVKTKKITKVVSL